MALTVEQVEKLRAAGFTDQEIASYEKEKENELTVAQTAPVDPNAPSVNEYGEPIISEMVPEMGPTMAETSGAGTALGLAPAVAAGVGGSILLGGLGYASKNYVQGKKADLAREELRQTKMMEREQFRQEQLNQRQQMRGQPMPPQAGPLQPGGPGQPQVQSQFPRGQFTMPQQPSMNTGMPSAINQPPAQPDKMTIFKQPSASNYIERMSELSKTYGEAQQRIRPESFAQTQPQPQAQPQPRPSGFPRGQFRGGGGGGGGGGMGMPFDPTNRRKPLQF